MTVANLSSRCVLFVSQDLQFLRSREPIAPNGKPALGESFSVCFATERTQDGQSGPGRPVTLLTASLWRDIITQMGRIEGLVKTNAADVPTSERWTTLKERWRRLADAVEEVEKEEGELPFP